MGARGAPHGYSLGRNVLVLVGSEMQEDRYKLTLADRAQSKTKWPGSTPAGRKMKSMAPIPKTAHSRR
jgi:hypothetical protein